MVVFQALSLDFLKRYFPRLYESLHVNILRGQLNLLDVDIPPTDPFTIFSYPFCVSSGTIESLTLHIPWTNITTSPIRLTARNVRINLREPSQASQQSVFTAFLRAAAEQRKRSVSSQDNNVSPLVRAVRKLVPLVLHRFELDLHDIQLTICFSNNCVASLALGALVTRASQVLAADFAKSFVLENFSFEISAPPNRPLSISVSRVEFDLALANTRYDVRLQFPGSIPLNIHASLAGILRDLSFRRRCWQLAFACGRPSCSVSEDPASWIRYAFRAALHSRGHSSVLTERHAVVIMRKCIRYERLHSLRLTRRLSSSNLAELEGIELELDSDMISLLSASAETKILANQASSFATTDWFRWTLFGSQVGAKRDAIAAEVRRAVFTTDNPDVAMPSFIRANVWSRARFCLRFEELRLTFSGTGNDFRCHATDVIMRSEAESNLDSFSVFTSVAEIMTFTDSFCSFHSLPRHDYNPNASLCFENVLQVLVDKPALADRVNISVRLQPALCTINLSHVREVTQFLSGFSSRLRTERSLFRKNSNSDSSYVRNSHSVGNVQRDMEFSIEVSRLDILIVDMPSFCGDGAREFQGVCVSFKDLSCRAELSAVHFKIHGCVRIEAAACGLKILSACRDGQGNRLCPHEMDALRASANITGGLTKNNFSLQVEGFKLTSNVGELESVVALIGGAVSAAKGFGHLQKNFSTPAVELSIENLMTPNDFLECHIVFSVVHVEILHTVGDVQGVLTFGATLLSLNNKRDSLFGTLRDANFSDSVGKGRLVITPAAGLKEALVIKVKKSESTILDFDVLVGNIMVSTGASSLVGVRKTLSPIPALTASWRMAVAASMSMNTSANVRGPRTSMAIQNIRIDLCLPLGLIVHLNHLSFVSTEPVLSGSCDRIKVVDTYNSSRCFIMEISHPIESRVSTDQRMLSFNVRPGHVNVHVSSTQIKISRSFCRRLNILTEIISCLTVEQEISPTVITQKKTQLFASSSDQLTTSITARGSNLSIDISEEPEFGNAVRVDIPDTTSVFSTASRVLSIRKVSILTKTDRNYGAVMHRAFPSRNNGRSNWKVMLRNLDADISYHSSSEDVNLTNCLHHKATLSLTFLSRIVVLLAPSQVRAITTALTQTFNIDKNNPTITRDETRPLSRFTGLSEASTFNNSSERLMNCTYTTAFRCETHATSFELLDEHCDGSVASTVALIELDPVLVTLKKVWDTTKSNVPTIVTKWRATCPSFRLEDRGVDTPISRQVVIETEESWIGIHGFSSQMLHHEDMRMGVSIEGIIKTHNNLTSRSHQINFKRSRVLLSSRLYKAVSSYYNKCAVPVETFKSSSDVEALDPQEIDTSISVDVPSSKLSIVFDEPVILLLSTGADLGDSMFQIRATSISGSLLYTKDGWLLPDSVVKIEQGQLFLTWNPRFEHEEHNHLDLSPNVDDEKEDFLIVSKKDEYDLSIGSMSRPNLRQGSANQEFLQAATQSVLEIGFVVIKLPVRTERRYTIVISDVIANLSLLTLRNAVNLAMALDIGTSEDRGVPAAYPDLQITVKTLVANVKVPNAEKDSDVLNTIALHIHISGSLFIAQNANLLSGETKISIDVHDDQQNVADHLILPLILSFKLRVFDQFCLELGTERFTRLTISPLTARAVTGVAITLLERKPRKFGDNHKCRTHIEKSGDERFSDFSKFCVHLTFKGIIIYCLAEDPRIQILRLVFREVRINLIISGGANSQGSINISLGDFLAEDTISWSLPWRVDDLSDPVRWSKFIIGNRRGTDTSNLDIQPFFSCNSSNGHYAATNVPNLRDGSSDVLCMENSPSVSLNMTWMLPWEHVSARLHSQGFEVNIDLALFSSVCEWFRSISNSIDLSIARYSMSAAENDYKLMNIGVDHIVLEPVSVMLSVRAPPRRLHETTHMRILNSIVCSETVEKMNIHLPRVVFNGDFPDIYRVFDIVGDSYLKTIRSTHIFNQMVWQLPSLVKLTRVMLASYLRQRNQILINRVESLALSNGIEHNVCGTEGLSSLLSGEYTPQGVFRRTRWSSLVSANNSKDGIQLKIGDSTYKTESSDFIDITDQHLG